MNSQQLVRPGILQAISHRNEDKRKAGRAELERLIFIEADRCSEEGVRGIVDMFRQRYLRSPDVNRKVIGLEVMIAILSGIQSNRRVVASCECGIVDTILECLIDNEARIRALTFEKIFEIIQMFKADSMRFFNQFFSKIIGCINDTEQSVKTACEFVDKKLKDLFQKHYEDAEFDRRVLISIIKSKIKTLNVEVRRYLIGWINLFLDLDMIVEAGEFLEDLLTMISDMEIENDVYECLGSFQFAIKQKFDDRSLEVEVSIGFIDEIVSILIKVATSKCASYTKLQALQWFKLFFVFFRQQVEVTVPRHNQKLYFKRIIIERFDEILEPILLLMSHEEEEVRRESIFVNDLLKESIEKVDKLEPINIIKIVPLLKEALSEKKASNTSEYALNWMKFMLQNYMGKIIPGMMEIVTQVMEKIYEGSAKNIHEIIEIMKSKEHYFELMVEKMLQFLNTKILDQEDRIELMLKKFISSNDVAFLWTSICQHIHKYEHQPLFMYEIASSLNSIIVNEANMRDVRKFLIRWNAPNYALYYQRMFNVLKYNPPAVIALSFLSRQYHLAFQIIRTLTGKRELSPKLLIGLCRLVSQLESPAFVSLRMHILQQDDYYLTESLNCLLMILPQGKIFNMLRNRLDAGGIISKQQKLQGPSQPPLGNPLDIEALFEEYKEVYRLK